MLLGWAEGKETGKPHCRETLRYSGEREGKRGERHPLPLMRQAPAGLDAMRAG